MLWFKISHLSKAVNASALVAEGREFESHRWLLTGQNHHKYSAPVVQVITRWKYISKVWYFTMTGDFMFLKVLSCFCVVRSTIYSSAI